VPSDSAGNKASKPNIENDRAVFFMVSSWSFVV
jgi:hypothetical protein